MSGGAGASVDTRTPEQIVKARRDEIMEKITAWKNSEFLTNADGNGDGPITVEQFVNYIRYNHAKSEVFSFTDTMVDWSLNLLRQSLQIRASRKIAIVSTHFGGVLYRIGTGDITDAGFADMAGELDHNGHEESPTYNFREHPMVPENFKTLQKMYETELAALTGKQYLFIPINSGYSSNATNRSHLAGAHWSFIVVDTTKKVARHIDSLAIPEKGEGGKYRVTNIETNGGVAGKVLCGLDTIMRYPQGEFTTSTLKWLPHQSQSGENADHLDPGACGPYVYALIKYILSNRELLLKGLKESFTKEKKQAYLREIRFNPKNSRNEIQAALWDLRKQKEDRDHSQHPMNLDPGDLEIENEKIIREGNLLLVLSHEILDRISTSGFLTAIMRNSTEKEKRDILNPRVLRATLSRDWLVAFLIAHERTWSDENYKEEINEYRKDPDVDDDDSDDSDDDNDNDNDNDNAFCDQLRTSTALQEAIDQVQLVNEQQPGHLKRRFIAQGAKELPAGMTREYLVDMSRTRIAGLKKVLAGRIASLTEHRRNRPEQLRAQLIYFRDTEAYTPGQRRRELRTRQAEGQYIGNTRKQFYRFMARTISELEEVLETCENDSEPVSSENPGNRMSIPTIKAKAPGDRSGALRNYNHKKTLVDRAAGVAEAASAATAGDPNGDDGSKRDEDLGAAIKDFLNAEDAARELRHGDLEHARAYLIRRGLAPWRLFEVSEEDFVQWVKHRRVLYEKWVADRAVRMRGY